ncbi:unnamed protein product [Arabidopsis lyrata]|nr:unnamed protein product [Arabidopsis lyrata]
MIESSYLAKKPLARYQNPKLLVLRSETSRDESSTSIFLETISKAHHDQSKIFICSYKFPDPQSEFYFDHVGRIMGYCNGLVCIYQSETIYIINPTTRKLRILSPEFLRDCTDTKNIQSNLACITSNVLLGTLLSSPKSLTSTMENEDAYVVPFVTINLAMKLAAVDLRTESFRYVLLPSWYINISESVNLWSLKDRLCLSDVLQCQYPSVDVWSLQQEDPSVKWEKIHSIKILSIDSLDVNFWKLGLAACSVRPVGEKPSKSRLEDVPDNHYRTRLFEENLVGFGLVS